MIFLSELIFGFFFDARTVTSTDDGQKEEWITLRNAVMRCAVLCCGYFF